MQINKATTQMSHSMPERILLRTMQGMAWGSLFAGAAIVGGTIMMAGLYAMKRRPYASDARHQASSESQDGAQR
jgi:hypothetical protein